MISKSLIDIFTFLPIKYFVIISHYFKEVGFIYSCVTQLKRKSYAFFKK